MTIEEKLELFLQGKLIDRSIVPPKSASKEGQVERVLLEQGASIQCAVLPSETLPHCFMGMDSYINPESYIRQGVFVGRYTSIGRRVSLGAVSHRIDSISMSPRLLPPGAIQPKNTVVGNDVWIGDNVVVLEGVRIGDGAVIGANSVVNRDVPPYEVVAGAPLRTLRRRFSDSVVNDLIELKWWNFGKPGLERVVKATSGDVGQFISYVRRVTALAQAELPTFKV